MSFLSRVISKEDEQLDLVALGVAEQEEPKETMVVDYLDADTVPVGESPEAAAWTVDQQLETLEELEEIQENQEEMQKQLEEQQVLIEQAIKDNGGVTEETAEVLQKSTERFYTQYEKHLTRFNKILNKNAVSVESFKEYKLIRPQYNYGLESFKDNSLKTVSTEALKDTLKSAIDTSIKFLRSIWDTITKSVKDLFARFFDYKVKTKNKLEAVLKKLKETGALKGKELTGSYLKVISHQGKVLQGVQVIDGFKKCFEAEKQGVGDTYGALKALIADKEFSLSTTPVKLYLADMVGMVSGTSWGNASFKLFREEGVPQVKDVKTMSLNMSEIESLAKVIIGHVDSGVFKSLQDEHKKVSAEMEKQLADLKKAQDSQEINVKAARIKGTVRITKQMIQGFIKYDKVVTSAGVMLCTDSITGSVKSEKEQQVQKLN